MAKTIEGTEFREVDGALCPVAEVIDWEPNPSYPGSTVFYVRCPYGCKRPHVHGGRVGDGWTTRVPHCSVNEFRDAYCLNESV